MRAILALLVSLTAFLPSGMALAQTPADAAAIRQILSSTFERPGSAPSSAGSRATWPAAPFCAPGTDNG